MARMRNKITTPISTIDVNTDTEAFHPSRRWPRVRDLAEAEREPFTRWLSGQPRPYLICESPENQDGYYGWDYDRWKRSQQNH